MFTPRESLTQEQKEVLADFDKRPTALETAAADCAAKKAADTTTADQAATETAAIETAAAQ